MSLLKSNSVQIGQSTTGTNNFTLSVPSSPDGTIKLARGNSGATTQDILSVNASGEVTLTNGGAITLATAQASVSGTEIGFTGIPSWVKRITMMFNGVSTNGAANLIIQLGTSSGYVGSGYLGAAGYSNSGASPIVTNHSNGFKIDNFGASVDIRHGKAFICLIGSNIWTFSSLIALSSATAIASGAGSIPLGGTLDRIRITADGSQTFDAGNINIMYEG